ncbi:MAG: right-handed parallel beta-helix repeat-containing protein [Spirochaetes bacterium]|nr:right-handed parallel beta-helix repeat-containing protein [Spirochaetota bacterium]
MDFKINMIIFLLILQFSCSNNFDADSSGVSGNITLPPLNIVFNNVYYVSTTGKDSTNTGTIDSPFATITKAMTLVKPGDCIYLRAGVYSYTSTINTNKSGFKNNYICIWAYQDEIPVLDFSGIGASSNALRIRHDYWYIKGLTIRYTTYNAIKIDSASYNLIVNCVVHDNGDTGIQIGGTGSSYNSVINCDSYRNYDPEEHGQDADGFGAKFEIGQGNYFYGCRAWNNSDDGWDFWMAPKRVIIENCWAFSNGINLWGDTAFEGNGNGIKLGGNYIAASHIVRNCLAFNNANKGFDQNNNTGPLTLYNNTSWHNGKNYGFWLSPTSGTNTLKNNISFEGQIADQLKYISISETNSWQGFTVTSDDFISLDTNLALAVRQSNGGLPDNGFLRLAASSDMINQGTDVGLPFKGTKPDLGAFEIEY